MEKKKLVASVAKQIDGCTRNDAQVVLETYADVVLESLKENNEDKIPFGNLGYFYCKHIPDKTGVATINGMSKEWFKPAHDKISFKLYKSAEARVNE